MKREEKLNILCSKLKEKNIKNLKVVKLCRNNYLLEHKGVSSSVSTKNFKYKKIYTYNELESILKNIVEG